MRRSTKQSFLAESPIFLQLTAIAFVLMLIPAIYAGSIDAYVTARAFLYSGLLGLIICFFIALAYRGRTRQGWKTAPLVYLAACYLVLPFFLAIPFFEALQTTSFLNAYLEMVSAITTTGLPLFTEPGRLNEPLHLWRAMVGWSGGLIIWVAAISILGPLNLGGFEVSRHRSSDARNLLARNPNQADTRHRVYQAARLLVPAYAGLTLALSVLLVMAGDRPLIAICHAMSIMATSGISPIGGLEAAESGIIGEMMMFVFFTFALSRASFARLPQNQNGFVLHKDPELRIAAAIIILVTTTLILRHFIAALDVDTASDLGQGLRAFWGAAFTVTSFLTTSGFVSSLWGDAQSWSGLSTPGVLLMGLALIGGGVATTAGGLKLLRGFALYLSGLREMEQLVYPSSIGHAAGEHDPIQRDGVFVAWVFFMLFVLSLALISIALSAVGLSFEEALLLSVAGMSNTGPLIEFASDRPIGLIELSPMAKILLGFAMVMGRLETLVIVALLFPNRWR